MKQDPQAIVAKYRQKYGEKSAYVGNVQHKLDVVPTGIMALDYGLGIGGWPRGHCVEVFGAPNIGKTSIIGYSAVAQAQMLGLQVGIICIEPRFDSLWAARNGIDVDNLVVMYPDTGEDAFEILRDWTSDPDAPFDYVLFDSIGALSTERDLKPEAAIQFGGQSKLITEGVKRMLMSAWKNNVGTMFINQQRDDVDSHISGLVDSPGGWAIKHAAMYRVHLRNGKERYTAMVDGDKRVVGRELIANIKKSAAGDSLGAQPRFDWYYQEVEGMPFGLDLASDVLNTGLKTKVISGSGWYKHPTFPKGQLQGKPAIAKFLKENPEAVEPIRQDVLKVMHRKREEQEARQAAKRAKAAA